MINEKLADLLRPWAGVWTWHTSHPLDQGRFCEAIESIFEEIGGDFLRSEFKDSFVSVISKTPDTLDGPPSEETIDRFVDEALGALKYLECRSGRV